MRELEKLIIAETSLEISRGNAPTDMAELRGYIGGKYGYIHSHLANDVIEKREVINTSREEETCEENQ